MASAFPTLLEPAARNAEYKPSWASLSSTAGPSAQTSWQDNCVSQIIPVQADTLNIPPGLARPAVPDGALDEPAKNKEADLAQENARLVLENEMLRLQCMQAAQGMAAMAAASALMAPHSPPTASGAPAMPSAETIERKQSADSVDPAEKTTLMLRNIPASYTRDMVGTMLDEEGFACMYDFVYLPIDYKSKAHLGYAFVNVITNEVAEEVWKVFEGYTKWTTSSTKVCSVNWSAPLQGLEQHVERFRNNPVMHESVEEIYKPLLLKNGVRVAFPPPTKKLRPPRARPGRGGAGVEEEPGDA